MALGRFEQAQKYFEQSLSILEVGGDEYWWACSQLSLSRLHAKQRENDASLAALEKCIPVFERLDASLDLAAAYELRQQLTE